MISPGGGGCQCLPCVRGGGAALCAVTEGLQIPALVRDFTYPSLSQPDDCQLPLHKGAKGRGAGTRRTTGVAVLEAFEPQGSPRGQGPPRMQSGFFLSEARKKAGSFRCRPARQCRVSPVTTCTRRQVGRLSAVSLLPTSNRHLSAGREACNPQRKFWHPLSEMWV